jgi:hypothetical protein
MVYSSIEIGCGYEGLVTLSSILWSFQYIAYNEKAANSRWEIYKQTFGFKG